MANADNYLVDFIGVLRHLMFIANSICGYLFVVLGCQQMPLTLASNSNLQKYLHTKKSKVRKKEENAQFISNYSHYSEFGKCNNFSGQCREVGYAQVHWASRISIIQLNKNTNSTAERWLAEMELGTRAKAFNSQSPYKLLLATDVY